MLGRKVQEERIPKPLQVGLEGVELVFKVIVARHVHARLARLAVEAQKELPFAHLWQHEVLNTVLEVLRVHCTGVYWE